MTTGARVAAAVALLAMVSSGCGGGDRKTEPAAEQPAVAWRQVDGAERRYRLFTPPSFEGDRPAPLVLALHGSGNSAESLVEASRLDDAATANGFVVAYPEATGLLWNAGFCCTSGRGDPDADVRYLGRVIDDVAGVRRIDTRRVYAVGVSAGAVMAYRLACDPAGRIAGVGSVAGTMPLDGCTPSRPVSVIQLHGTGDQLVPYDGGRVVGGATGPAPAAVTVAERWAALDACPGVADARTDGPVTTVTWAGCPGDAKVRLVTVRGGGHSWFSPEFGLPNGAVDATASIIGFLGLAR